MAQTQHHQSPGDVTRHALSLQDLRKLDPKSDPIWILNTSDNVGNHRGDVFVAIRQTDGRTDVVEIPDSWLPFDMTQKATFESIMRSSHFMEAINSGMITAVTAQYAEELTSRETASVERRRLKGREQAVQAATQANGIGKNVTISSDDDDFPSSDQALLDQVNNRSRAAISVTDIDSPDADPYPKVSASFRSWVTKNNDLSVEAAINDLKVRGKVSADEAEYYVDHTSHDRIRTYLKSRM